VGEILQQQWRTSLSIDVNLRNQEGHVLYQTMVDKTYAGIAHDVWSAFYTDHNDFLSLFETAHLVGATWQDRRYGALLADANSTIDPAARMKKLAEAESYLLKAMPIIPLFFDAWTYLQKPFVRGMQANLFGMPLFKYAWIDTHWKPEEERN
jgi:oligopeptide transport system substrate-binding protein